MISTEGPGALKDRLIGQVVQGRYRVCRVIGRGGMGVVYEAQHVAIERKVALKTLCAQAAISPASVQRFRREAIAAASVGNSHVVEVLDMGQLDDGSFFMVLEHLNGVDLGYAVALERCFSVRRAINVLCQLCDALSAVHAAGIVHRDLKPENIFLIVRDGKPDFVKVLDFGVCKFDDPEAQRLTATGDTVGTPLFMAPEQAEGRRDLDHRTDVYALGAILYFALTGQAPFRASSLPGLFVKICHEAPPSARISSPHLPPGLDAVIQRALCKLPEGRFASCEALKSALLPFAGRSSEGDADTLPDATAARFMEGDDTPGTASLVRALKIRDGLPRRLLFGVGAAALLAPLAVLSYWRSGPQPAPILRAEALKPDVTAQSSPKAEPAPAPIANPTPAPDAIPGAVPRTLVPAPAAAQPRPTKSTNRGVAAQESMPSLPEAQPLLDARPSLDAQPLLDAPEPPVPAALPLSPPPVQPFSDLTLSNGRKVGL